MHTGISFVFELTDVQNRRRPSMRNVTSDIQTLRHGVSLSASALNTSRKTSSSCPRFNLASDYAGPPVPTSWFLPHAGLHLATEHSQSQELEHGTSCRPVSPPHHLCPHFGRLLKFSFPATTASITLITVSWSWSA